jgi:uncharacterized RDD family membrane protein YckC
MTNTPDSRAKDSDMKPIGFDTGARSHAYDPVTQPEYFEDLLGRRMMAFLVDVIAVTFLFFAAVSLIFILGFVTFGLAWLMFGIVFPLVALGYSAWTMSSPPSATFGMRLFDLEIRTWYGARMTGLLGAFHTLLFYFSVSILTPFILLLALFDGRKRCLHDMLMGTVIVNNEFRAKLLRG